MIGIPTPVLTEFLCKADSAAQAIVETLKRSSAIRILPFDLKAARECALMYPRAIGAGLKRGAAKGEPYQKVKVDRQIVAIAKAEGANGLVSGDEGLLRLATDEGSTALRIQDLPLPMSARQTKLDLQLPGGTGSSPGASSTTTAPQRPPNPGNA